MEIFAKACCCLFCFPCFLPYCMCDSCWQSFTLRRDLAALNASISLVKNYQQSDSVDILLPHALANFSKYRWSDGDYNSRFRSDFLQLLQNGKQQFEQVTLTFTIARTNGPIEKMSTRALRFLVKSRLDQQILRELKRNEFVIELNQGCFSSQGAIDLWLDYLYASSTVALSQLDLNSESSVQLLVELLSLANVTKFRHLFEKCQCLIRQAAKNRHLMSVFIKNQFFKQLELKDEPIYLQCVRLFDANYPFEVSEPTDEDMLTVFKDDIRKDVLHRDVMLCTDVNDAAELILLVENQNLLVPSNGHKQQQQSMQLHQSAAAYHVHKVVLAARCNYLGTMINGASKQVVVPDMANAVILKALVDYLYTDQVYLDEDDDVYHVFELIRAAKTMSLERLEHIAVRLACQRIEGDTIVDISKFALDMDLQELLEHCYMYICYAQLTHTFKIKIPHLDANLVDKVRKKYSAKVFGKCFKVDYSKLSTILMNRLLPGIPQTMHTYHFSTGESNLSFNLGSNSSNDNKTTIINISIQPLVTLSKDSLQLGSTAPLLCKFASEEEFGILLEQLLSMCDNVVVPAAIVLVGVFEDRASETAFFALRSFPQLHQLAHERHCLIAIVEDLDDETCVKSFAELAMHQCMGAHLQKVKNS